MYKVATSVEQRSTHLPPRVSRARSLPSRRPYDVAVLCSMIHYLGIIVTITALVYCIRAPSHLASKLFVGALLFSAAAWLVAFFKRRSTHCPLCKGTPLINSGALTHKRASRIYPFNHGVSATLSIIATQRFRCMYCGSDYDLLKYSSRLHSAGQHSRSEEEESSQNN